VADEPPDNPPPLSSDVVHLQVVVAGDVAVGGGGGFASGMTTSNTRRAKRSVKLRDEPLLASKRRTPSQTGEGRGKRNSTRQTQACCKEVVKRRGRGPNRQRHLDNATGLNSGGRAR
jgi:hypothetical protein